MEDDLKRDVQAGTTIVGGQPPTHQRARANASVGVERALYLAASDPAFAERLRTDRRAALSDPRLRLRPSEVALLAAAPEQQLWRAVERLDVSADNLGRRHFLRAVAATAVAAAAAGCSDDNVEVKPDWPSAGVPDGAVPPEDGPPDVAVYPEMPPPAGDRPNMDGPPDLATDGFMLDSAGIRPGDS